MYPQYDSPYRRESKVYLERSQIRLGSTAPIRITLSNMDKFQQRCGREVDIIRSNCSKSWGESEFAGSIVGKVELKNGGIGYVEWGIDGHCNEVTLVLDAVNGVDQRFVQETINELERGDFDLVPKMITKQELQELKEMVKPKNATVVVRVPQALENVEVKVSLAHPGDDSCDCGATKNGWGHSHWCRTQGK